MIGRRVVGRSRGATGVVLALAVLLGSLLLPGLLRAAVSLPIVLLAPGYALQLAFGRRLRQADGWLTVALSLILSAALLPLLVLLLYAVRRPLDAHGIIAVVMAVTLLLALVGLWRNPDRDASESGTVGAALATLASLGVSLVPDAADQDVETAEERAPVRRRRLPVPVKAIAAALALVCTGAIILVTWSALPGATPARYSAIALDGHWSRLAGVTVVRPGRALAVQVRVENHTATVQHYRVVPTVKGASWTSSGVTLAPGRSWSGTVSGSIPSGGCLHQLSIALRCDAGACRQSLVLWLSARATLPPSCSTSVTGS